VENGPAGCSERRRPASLYTGNALS